MLIARRLSITMHDSAIFVSAKGRIVGSVTHAALLEGKGFVYYAIWRQQIGKWPAWRGSME